MTEKWMELFEKNEKLEGNVNPENLPMLSVVKRGAKGNSELSDLMEDDSVDEKAQAPTSEEKPYLGELRTLSKTEDLSSKYTLPISELSIALGEGLTRKAKSIVQILLDVKTLTENDQIEDKL